MKTQGEIECEISECMGRFEQEYVGRGPERVRAYLIGDLVVVRLSGVLTAAEQHLAKTLANEKGRDLLKQVRSQLIEIARPTIEAMVKGITGVKVVSLHHDISTATGEEVVLFTLARAPACREPKKNNPTDVRRSTQWETASIVTPAPTRLSTLAPRGAAYAARNDARNS
jgi:uncharacterized protein YbcI